VERPKLLEARIPAAVSDTVLACLARDPAERPTPAEVAAQLESVLEALPKPKISKLKPRLR
jgi:hypothetical protein